MDNQITVALIAFAGTAIGTFGGIIASTKEVNIRLKALEEKVNKHNDLVERMGIAETNITNIYKKIE